MDYRSQCNARVNSYLEKAFRKIAPKEMTSTKLKELFNYTGPLGGLSSRISLAYTSRLTTSDLYRALHILRDLRNEAAHPKASFSLANHKDRLRSLHAYLGPEMDIGINRLALHSLMASTIQILMARGAESVEELGMNPFQSPQDVIEALRSHPEALDHLDNRLYRYELAVGVAIICALILIYRDAACRVLGESTVIGFVYESTDQSSDPCEA
jgi:DNA-binding MltR family transcriptional regulator